MKANHFFTTSLASTALILLGQSTKAQTFENLDFQGQWSDGGIPGWTAVSYPFDPTPGDPGGDFTATSYIWPNNQALGEIDQSTVGLIVYTPNPAPYTIEPIDGLQSLYMSAVPFGGPATSVTSISQVGTVPSTAKSILFFAGDIEEVNGAPIFGLSFGGRQLSLQVVIPPTSGGVAEYAANISQFADQSGDLTLSLTGGDVWAEIGNIQFSNIAVPEPKAFSILTTGICLALIGFRRGKVAA